MDSNGRGRLVPGREGAGWVAGAMTPAAAIDWKKSRRRIGSMAGGSWRVPSAAGGRGRPRGAAAVVAVGLEQRGQPAHDVRPVRVQVVGFTRVVGEVVELTLGLAGLRRELLRERESAGSAAEDQLPIALADREHADQGVVDGRLADRRPVGRAQQGGEDVVAVLAGPSGSRSPTIAAQVAIRSTRQTVSSQVVPAGTRPGQRDDERDAVPPFVGVPLHPPPRAVGVMSVTLDH